ncbi:YdaU family protein [Cupriavidus gilardii]|uniref:YdaU family protein n=1 Tax=Cupriavidus gilardii TaxID=82541 RepID=UPI0021B46149|nr:YdaU family protein [Cupriavidus gilardii]UXC36645.1 YdaU family protein [Cupriavidus gilardii]
MKLPFRQLDIGERLEQTIHLSIVEIGALTFLEDLYWRTGELPPKAALEATFTARGGDLKVLAKILKTYFPKRRAPHLDEQRARAIAKSEVNRANGKKGGRPPKAQPEAAPEDASVEF